MNKYDSKTGVTMFLIMALLCFVTIFFYIFWATSGIFVPAIIFTVLLLVFYVPIYFFTNYEIDSTYVYMRKGFFKKKIPLEKIEAVYPTKNCVPSFATSYHRIAIVYSEDNKTKKAYVSPFLYSAFLNDLTDMTLDNVILANPTDRQAFMQQTAKQNNETKAEETNAEKNVSKIENDKTETYENKVEKTKTAATAEPVKKKAESTSAKKAGRPKKSATTKKKVGRPKKEPEKRKVGRPKKNA